MDGQEPEVVTEEIQEVTEPVEAKPEEIDPTPKESDPKWYKERFAKITKQKYERDAEIARLKEELNRYKTDRPEPKAPVISQFTDMYGTFDEAGYQKAMGEYIDKRTELKKETENSKSLEDQYYERKQERIDIFNSQVAELRKDIPDIDQVISKPIWSQVIGKPLEDAIYESDDSARIADYLGRNEAEIIKLNQMPVPKMIEYIGRLEEKFAFQERKSSKAVPPINPVDGNNGKVAKDLSEISDDDEWYREHQKERMRKFQKG